VVIVGLALVWLGQNAFPGAARVLQRADAVAALGVAVIVFFVSYRLGRRTVEVLLDRAPDGIPQRLREAAAEVEGVLRVGQVRVRRSGPQYFVDMTVDVDRNLSFERTHAIAEDVEAHIQSIAPGADVVVHTDPREVEREALAKRIRAVAYRNQMAVHNIALYEDKGQVFVGLHLEVDDHLSLEQAHEMASRIEEDLRTDMPEIDRVDVHLESRGSGIGDGRDVTHQEGELVETVKRLTDEIAGPSRCHNVLVRRQGKKISLSLHCHLDKELSIVEIHDITSRIETRLRERIPGVDRCVVHAEPEKS
jgi:divalent metal cation (Fe/Co/Zn/Cd) transporter